MTRKQSIFVLIVVAVSFVMAVTDATYAARPISAEERKAS